ncbi:hypothetical protein ACS5PN_13030 [Roseateles sp. NT4]|uniref:hypothetical protein n=1 Tax=Roseateles sp. NT4 TaxID=3453715 RepID=UPI003EEB45C2
MTSAIRFKPRFWLQAGDASWYPAPWWAETFPLLDAFADPAHTRAEQIARAHELREIVERGERVLGTAPGGARVVSDAVLAVYARAGVSHLLSQH